MRRERRTGRGGRGAGVSLAACLGLVAAALAAPALAGCGGAWSASGHVTDCLTGAPLVGVRVVLSKDDDVGETTSEPDGHFAVAINAPPEGAATLVLSKPTYRTRTEAYDAPPEESQALCLDAQ